VDTLAPLAAGKSDLAFGAILGAPSDHRARKGAAQRVERSSAHPAMGRALLGIFDEKVSSSVAAFSLFVVVPRQQFCAFAKVCGQTTVLSDEERSLGGNLSSTSSQPPS
jgi:hypothetical protein